MNSLDPTDKRFIARLIKAGITLERDFHCSLFINSTYLSYLWSGLIVKPMTVKDFFSLKSNKYFWVNIIAMIVVVIALLFITFQGLAIYTKHGEAVVVPDVKGISVEEATALFSKNGLKCIVSDSTYVKNKAAGVILDLSPAPGQKVKEGRMIYLTINSLNTPLYAVPDLADNSSVRQAEAKLLALGFKIDEIQSINGEKDWVYGVKYKGRQLVAGEKVPMGAKLTLMVGNGTIVDEFSEDSLNQDQTVEPEAKTTERTTSSSEENWF